MGGSSHGRWYQSQHLNPVPLSRAQTLREAKSPSRAGLPLEGRETVPEPGCPGGARLALLGQARALGDADTRRGAGDGRFSVVPRLWVWLEDGTGLLTSSTWVSCWARV